MATGLAAGFARKTGKTSWPIHPSYFPHLLSRLVWAVDLERKSLQDVAFGYQPLTQELDPLCSDGELHGPPCVAKAAQLPESGAARQQCQPAHVLQELSKVVRQVLAIEP
jgi:hypothetical protein